MNNEYKWNLQPTPFVGIVMPTHTEHPYSENVVQSVLGQTSKNWSLVVVDNSPDFYFGKRFGSLLEKYPNIAIKNVKNTGLFPGYYKMLGARECNCSENGFVVFWTTMIF